MDCGKDNGMKERYGWSDVLRSLRNTRLSGGRGNSRQVNDDNSQTTFEQDFVMVWLGSAIWRDVRYTSA